jgi:hypothetical protein
LREPSSGICLSRACGHVAAAYLLDLVLDGAPLDKVADAAAGIAYAHRMSKQYLDWAPIDAALDYAIESP